MSTFSHLLTSFGDQTLLSSTSPRKQSLRLSILSIFEKLEIWMNYEGEVGWLQPVRKTVVNTGCIPCLWF